MNNQYILSNIQNRVLTNYDYTFSIYNLSLLDNITLNNIIETIDCLSKFKDYYKCNNSYVLMIIQEIIEFKKYNSIDVWSTSYYNECLILEKIFKNKKYLCHFCKKQRIKNEIKKCSRCKKVRYCSIACHLRNWSQHKHNCKKDESESKNENESKNERENENENENENESKNERENENENENESENER